MNITFINTSDISGGAARAMHRLHSGCIKLGHNSEILVKNKFSDNMNVIEVVPWDVHTHDREELYQKIQNKIIDENRTSLSNTYFSNCFSGYFIDKTQYSNSDVINIHWVARFLNVDSIADIMYSGKPVVLTLHDEWMYTGGCHYTAGCDGFSRDCMDCPQLFDNRFQLPFLSLERKKQLYGNNIAIVTPSTWLADRATKSSLFNDTRVVCIPNPHDTDFFKPAYKSESKKKLGIDVNTKVLLFGCHSHEEKRKGFHKLVEAIALCKADPRFNEIVSSGRLKILVFGKPSDELYDLKLPVLDVGYIDDDLKLVEVYSAADFVVLPSLEDNLPNIMTEAMSCGVPVIAFRTGGMMDMIRDDCGALVEYNNHVEFSKAIITFLQKDLSLYSLNARKRAVEYLDNQKRTSEYIDLFESMIKEGAYSEKTFYSFQKLYDHAFFEEYSILKDALRKLKKRKIKKYIRYLFFPVNFLLRKKNRSGV